MRDRFWIAAGLAVFAMAVTAPFWSARPGAKDLTRLPDLALPANQKQCVAPVADMRSAHMQMLVRWRTDVVRRGDRKYVAFDGKVYDMSLTKTCLGCHNKEQFCDRCHTYAGVSGPYCWNCHSAPQTAAAATNPAPMQPEAGATWMARDSLPPFFSGSNEPSSPSPRSVP